MVAADRIPAQSDRALTGVFAMADIKLIEAAVRALPTTDLAEFRRWFAEFDSSAWDRQIESDLASGRLCDLLAEAKAELASAPARRL